MTLTDSADFAGNDFQNVDVANDLIGLRDDGNAQTLAFGQFFQARSRDAVFFFGRLIGIRSSANGDMFGLGITAGFRFIRIFLC